MKTQSYEPTSETNGGYSDRHTERPFFLNSAINSATRKIDDDGERTHPSTVHKLIPQNVGIRNDLKVDPESNGKGLVELQVKGVRGAIKVKLHGESKQDFMISADKSYKNNKEFGLQKEPKKSE